MKDTLKQIQGNRDSEGADEKRDKKKILQP